MKDLKYFPYSLIAERLYHFISGFQYSSAFAENTKKTRSKVNKCFNTGILITLQSHYLLILVINAADTQCSIINE